MPHPPQISAQDVADYFLGTLDEESGDNITQLKLQKLLYYAQGLHVAMHGEALFPDRILAWREGPVVRPIWDRYKRFGWSPIESPAGFDQGNYPPETQELLSAVYTTYGQFSAWKLSDMTHEEPPWKETLRNNEITLKSLRLFFSRIVEAGKSGDALPGEPVWPTTSFRFQNRRRLSQKFSERRARLREIAASAPRVDPWADSGV